MTSTMIDNLARMRARASTTPAQVNTVKQLIDTARSARNWWIERTRWTVSLPDRDQLVRLWRSFYGQPEPPADSPLWIPPEGLTPAVAIEAFKRWPGDPLGGIEQIQFAALAPRP